VNSASFRVKVLFLLGISPGERANDDEYNIFDEHDRYGKKVVEKSFFFNFK
jgi:hypothetical protein